MIAEVGIPFAYYQFDNESAKEPPFICFYYPNDDDLKADNINYSRINQVVVELYTNNKDFELEKTVETVLMSHGLAFTRVETFIDSQQLYEVVFTTEIVITEE